METLQCTTGAVALTRVMCVRVVHLLSLIGNRYTDLVSRREHGLRVISVCRIEATRGSQHKLDG